MVIDLMKKLLSALLGLSLLLGTVSVAFGQHGKSGHSKRKGGSKRGRKGPAPV
jgi:hypothetical protein